MKKYCNITNKNSPYGRIGKRVEEVITIKPNLFHFVSNEKSCWKTKRVFKSNGAVRRSTVLFLTRILPTVELGKVLGKYSNTLVIKIVIIK